MADLDTLRPEVAQALGFIERNQKYGDGSVCAGDIDIIRAELLRLTDDCARLVDCINAQPPTRRSLIDRAERAEAELAESRETIKRLNRRAQVAEAGVVEKVKEHAGGSLGRALANAASDMYMRERDEAQAELEALKAKIAEAPVATLVYGQSDMLSVLSAENPDDWAGRLVRLVVEK